MKKGNLFLLLVCLIIWKPVVSMAFIPVTGQHDQWEPTPVDYKAEKFSLPMNAWIDFIERYGSKWKIDWDEEMGTPHAIYGWGIEIIPGGIVSEGFLSERLLSFVDDNSGLFGISSADLEPASIEVHGRLWYATYQQVIHSVPVYGGIVQFRIRKDGRLVSISSRIHPGVDLITSPAIPMESAEARAKGDAFFAEDRDIALPPVLVVYPDRTGQRTKYFLSWMVELITHEPPGHWFYMIDAHNGNIVRKWNQIYYDGVSPDSIFGTVTGFILPEIPSETPEERPLKDLIVSLRGGDSSVTDSAGDYLIETDSADSILAALLGPFVDVNRADGVDASVRLEGLLGIPNPILWDDMNSDMPERNGFYHTIVVHDYVKALDSTFTGLDYRMPCEVNLDMTCNAFWDGIGMNFFRAGDGCVNTALIADVIYHEYGHGVTDFQYRPNPQPSGAMHEGFSDYLAATITNQPLVGRGFFGPGSWIRSTENNRVYPAPECGGEPHCVGEAIAGALWDMRQNLVTSLGEEAGIALADTLFHYNRYGFSTIFPDYFIDILVLDDDDGNLFNGIPHSNEICDGFGNHGLPCVLTPNAPVTFDAGNGNELVVVWQAVPSLLAPVSDYILFFGEESDIYTDSLASGGDTTVLVTGLNEGQVYYFALMAEDSTGIRSNMSQEGTGTPLSVPLPPSGLFSRSQRDNISLTWLMNKELDIEAYIILRSEFADSSYSEIDTVTASDTTYIDSTPEPNIMYYYRVEAMDGDGEISDPSSTVRGRLMSLDSGILVIDGTLDGQDGIPFSWADSTVDHFYSDLLKYYPVSAEYDIADSIDVSSFELDQAIMAPYSTVVWHEDDRTSPSMIPYLEDIGSYLSQGGNLFLSGWHLVRHLSGEASGTVVFPPGSVPHDYLKMDSVEVIGSSIRDFAGADSEVSDYPTLSVDSTKAPLLGGNLFEMDVLFELVDEPVTEPIYSYRSSEGDTATYHGETVGLRYLGEDYRLVIFDFPLFYIQREAAEQAMAQAMDDLGEIVGIAGQEETMQFPRAFAISQNYPNPFNPSTSIVIEVPQSEGKGEDEGIRTQVRIYDMRGHLVKVLLDEPKKPGRYILNWDGRNSLGEKASSGLYLYHMKAGDFVSTRKMVLLK